jgi:hypothetical protein
VITSVGPNAGPVTENAIEVVPPGESLPRRVGWTTDGGFSASAIRCGSGTTIVTPGAAVVPVGVAGIALIPKQLSN